MIDSEDDVVWWDILCVVLFAVGFVIIFFSADGLMDNLRWIADKFNVHPVILGVIILGTDPEECIVSILSAIRGLKYVAIGNVIGNSLMANTLCFSLPFLLFPQSSLDVLSDKLQSQDTMKIPTFYYILIIISSITIALNGIPALNHFEYNLLLLSLINLLFFAVYIIKNVIKYSRDNVIDIHIEASSSSSSSSSSKDALNVNGINYGATETAVAQKRLRNKKIKKCLGVVMYMVLLIVAGELCVYATNELINTITWLNQSLFGYIILAFVTNAEEMMYTINAFRKNKTSRYALGIGGMIGKLFFNINFTFGICGLILRQITFRTIDIINSVAMVISMIYLSLLLRYYRFSKVHGVILLGGFIGFCVYNVYFAEVYEI